MTGRLDIPGLGPDVNECIQLLNIVRQRVEHYGAAGVRAPNRRPGMTMQYLCDALAELEALRTAIEDAQPKPVEAAQ